MGKINKVLFRKKVGKVLNSPKTQKRVYEMVRTRFESAKKEMVDQFDNHPVTKEIQGGAEANNSSKTLGGYGNLFSFIGFTDKNPTAPIRSLLRSTSLSTSPRATEIRTGEFEYRFRIVMPSKQDLAKVSVMPWESGRSWLLGIEQGISGLSYYIYKKFISASNTRTGIQTSSPYIEGLIFRRTPYISPIINKFKISMSS